MYRHTYVSMLVLPFATVALLTTPVYAQTTWYVDDDAPNDPGPGDPMISDPDEDGSPEHPFDAIQEGIDAAVDGDTVLVADGLYTGHGNRGIVFGGRCITLRSQYGPQTTVIDCENANRALYFDGGDDEEVRVEGFTIQNGSTSGFGGGASCYHDGTQTIVNCVFRNCYAEHGGGVFARSVIIEDCSFISNTASQFGGGLRACNVPGKTLIRNCLFASNVAYRGGGLCMDDLDVANCIFMQNQATYGGGVFYYGYGKSATISNCLVTGNQASFKGGGIWEYDANLTLTNCSVADNTAARGGGIHCRGSGATLVQNCILWGDAAPDGPEIYQGDPAAITVCYSDVQGGQGGVFGNVQWGPGNIDADPLFVDPGTSGNHWDTATDNDYRLGPGSPCIDAADNQGVPDGVTTDLGGNPRFVDDPNTPDTGNGTPPIVDMGAYEFQVGCPGDVDGDNDTDQEDLGVLLSDWGCGGRGCPGDLDGDGDTDQTDLDVLLGDWGCAVEP